MKGHMQNELAQAHTRNVYLQGMELFDGQKMTRPPHDTGHCTETKVIYVMLWGATNGGERDCTWVQWTMQRYVVCGAIGDEL